MLETALPLLVLYTRQERGVPQQAQSHVILTAREWGIKSPQVKEVLLIASECLPVS